MEVFPVVTTELCLLVFLLLSIFPPSFFLLVFLLYYYSDERGEQGEISKLKPAQKDSKVPTFFFRIHNRTKGQYSIYLFAHWFSLREAGLSTTGQDH